MKQYVRLVSLWSRNHMLLFLLVGAYDERPHFDGKKYNVVNQATFSPPLILFRVT